MSLERMGYNVFSSDPDIIKIIGYIMKYVESRHKKADYKGRAMFYHELCYEIQALSDIWSRYETYTGMEEMKKDAETNS